MAEAAAAFQAVAVGEVGRLDEVEEAAASLPLRQRGCSAARRGLQPQAVAVVAVASLDVAVGEAALLLWQGPLQRGLEAAAACPAVVVEGVVRLQGVEVGAAASRE